MTCALVPVNPKELTPARRGRSVSGHVSHVVGTVTASDAHGMYGFGVWKWSDAGISPRSSASTVLMRPAIPAAASRWPMLVFTDPIESGRARPSPSTAASASTSIGSPSEVPVPCAST